MRALIRRIVDHILGCRPKQVARRRDLYGWSGTPQELTPEELERAAEAFRRAQDRIVKAVEEHRKQQDNKEN